MNLDLVKLRTLIEVRATGSMTAAAAALGYTTGAVSQQMAGLQRAVRTELFVQVGRRVQLTDAGHVLADHATGLLALAADAEAALAGLPGQPTARVLIGVFGTAAAALLPRCLIGVRDRYPRVRLRSVEVDVDAATYAVAAGSVDLAFGVDYPRAPIPRAADVAMLTLATEPFSIAIPLRDGGPRPSAGGRSANPASLADFRDHAWILPPEATCYGRAIRMACRRLGFEPQVDHTVTDTATTLSLVAAGLGIAPVTDLMLTLATQPLRTVPVTDGTERTMVLAHRRHPTPQPGVRAVIEVIQNALTDS